MTVTGTAVSHRDLAKAGCCMDYCSTCDGLQGYCTECSPSCAWHVTRNAGLPAVAIPDSSESAAPAAAGAPSRFNIDGVVERYAASAFPLRSMAADLAKKNRERRDIHEMLSAAGISEELPGGRICLIGRVELALAELQYMRGGITLREILDAEQRIADGARGR